MKEAALILLATVAFAGVAFTSGRPAPEAHCPETIEVVRYLDQPEIQPLYPPPRLLPVNEIGPPKVEAEPVVEEEPERHHRRHRRHHRRRR